METDFEILEKKALAAIDNCKVDMVVANELHSNRWKVQLYSSLNRQAHPLEVGKDDSTSDIEEKII